MTTVKADKLKQPQDTDDTILDDTILDDTILDDDLSEKSLTTANVGASIPEDVKSDVNANDSLYKVGSPVVVKTTGDAGFVVGLARVKGGSYLYTVQTQSGVYVTAKDDLQHHSDISKAVKAVNSAKDVAHAFTMVYRQMTITDTLLARGRTAYELRNMLQDVLKSLSRIVSMVPRTAISYRQLDSVARQYAQVLSHTQRNWKRGRDTEMQADIDKLIKKTLRGVRQRLKRIERFYLTREAQKRVAMKGETMQDAPAPYTRTLSAVLHDIVQGAQEIINEGQPIAVAGRIVNETDDIRLVGLVVQVVSENGDGFDPVATADLDKLAEQLEVMKPTEHKILVTYAFNNGHSVPANVLVEYPSVQNRAVKAGILSLRRAIGFIQQMLNKELPDSPTELRKLVNMLEQIPHLNDDAKSTLMIAQEQLEAIANGGTDVTLENAKDTVRLVLAKQVATKNPDAEDAEGTPSVKSITVKEAVVQMGLSHKREKADTLLKSAHRFPDELRPAIRKLNNARRSGLMSGRAEQAISALNARGLLTLLVKLNDQGIAQADVVDWVGAYLAPSYQAQGGTPIKSSDDDAPTGDIVADWSAYAEALTGAIKSATLPNDEGISNVLDAIRMEAMDTYDADKDAILAHVVSVENALYEEDNVSEWRERALQTATSFEQAVRQMQTQQEVI